MNVNIPLPQLQSVFIAAFFFFSGLAGARISGGFFESLGYLLAALALSLGMALITCVLAVAAIAISHVIARAGDWYHSAIGAAERRADEMLKEREA